MTNPLTFLYNLFFSRFSKEELSLQDELEAIRDKNKSVFHILMNLELNKHLLLQERIKEAFKDYDNPH